MIKGALMHMDRVIKTTDSVFYPSRNTEKPLGFMDTGK